PVGLADYGQVPPAGAADRERQGARLGCDAAGVLPVLGAVLQRRALQPRAGPLLEGGEVVKVAGYVDVGVPGRLPAERLAPDPLLGLGVGVGPLGELVPVGEVDDRS